MKVRGTRNLSAHLLSIYEGSALDTKEKLIADRRYESALSSPFVTMNETTVSFQP